MLNNSGSENANSPNEMKPYSSMEPREEQVSTISAAEDVEGIVDFQVEGGRSASSSSSSSPPDERVPSNETLLGTAFITFMGFALLQLGFALVAGSAAMLGDSVAMVVDAMTYLFNLFAERKKAQVEDAEYSVRHPSDLEYIERIKRKRVLQFEIIPPLLSVSVLLILTVIILRSAIQTLILDLYRSQSEQSTPDIDLMLIFSSVNLLLDFLNVFCFAKAKHLRGYTTVEQYEEEDDEEMNDNNAGGCSLGHVSPACCDGEADGINLCEEHDDSESMVEAVDVIDLPRKFSLATLPNGAGLDTEIVSTEPRREQTDGDKSDRGSCEQQQAASSSRTSADKLLIVPVRSHRHTHHTHGEANLNMCSAYTHIFADTLRSIAVLFAAAIAKLVPGVTAEEADATAAVFVSILIVLSLVPLLRGLYSSCSELLSIRAIDRREARIQR